jgi:aminoglycoside 6-adenylyltransferase
MQTPDNWYSHPYDFSSRDSFAYLMQFKDGKRVDLTIFDINNYDRLKNNNEPIIKIFSKSELDIIEISNDKAFFSLYPSRDEFLDMSSEFTWLTLYVAKGLLRSQNILAWHYLNELLKIYSIFLAWKKVEKSDFPINYGKYFSYLDNFKTDLFMKTQVNWDYLQMICNEFKKVALEISNIHTFDFKNKEFDEVMKMIDNLKKMD